MRFIDEHRATLIVSMCASLCILQADAAETTSAHPKSDRIDRGRYLVKTTGCNDCHTPAYAERAGDVPESQWLIGHTLGWQGPWGTTYPINLRRLVSRVSASEWLEIARRPSRPPMPWFALRDMSDEDLTAIYSYIRSLGPAGEEAPSFVPPGQDVRTPVVRFPSGDNPTASPAASSSERRGAQDS